MYNVLCSVCIVYTSTVGIIDGVSTVQKCSDLNDFSSLWGILYTDVYLRDL